MPFVFALLTVLAKIALHDPLPESVRCSGERRLARDRTDFCPRNGSNGHRDILHFKWIFAHYRLSLDHYDFEALSMNGRSDRVSPSFGALDK